MSYQVLPDLSAEDYAALKADIAARGIMVPVEYDDQGNVIDGHHRIRACQELGIQEWPRLVRTYPDEAAKRTQARKLNIARRHLDTAAKRLLIEQELRENPARSGRQIASELGVDNKTVEAVRDDLEQREEIPHVSEIRDTLGRIQPASKPSRTIFIDDSDAGKRAAVDRYKDLRADKIEERRVERLQNLAEIAKGNAALGTSARYPILYADPPWKYENPPIGATNRAIENHYPTMTLEEICALPVAQLGTDDAMLYMWATAPKLAECMQVIEAWGFTYRTCMVWVKDKIGMGYHVRNQHEILLIAKRGELPPPPVDARVSSVVHAVRGEHSEKPEEFYTIIENMYPELPKIELFARSKREGWESWGNQANAA